MEYDALEVKEIMKNYASMSEEELIDRFYDDHSVKCKIPETRGELILALERAELED